MPPRQLQYPASVEGTPKSSKSSFSLLPTPVSPDVFDSPSSQSSITPTMQSMPICRGRGQPHKQLEEPNYDGYPVDGMEEEKKQWLKMKATEKWHYNILTSNKAEDYHQCEKTHVSEYNARRGEQKKLLCCSWSPSINSNLPCKC